MTTQELAAMVGKRVVFMGGPCAASVDVIDARVAFGREDYKVRDCLGRERWVSAQACTVAGGEAADNKAGGL